MKKKNVGLGVGLALLGCGAAVGAVFAKKYYEKRKERLETYDIEVDRLKKEVDFDYSEDFLKELKKETLHPDKKNYSKEEILSALRENKYAFQEQILRLENLLKEHLKKETKTEQQVPVEDTSEISIEIVEDVEE